MALPADGKIVLAGYTVANQQLGPVALMRLNADGTPDASFGSGGTTITVAGSQFHLISTMALQSDGKS